MTQQTNEGLENLECEDKEEVAQVHAEFQKMLKELHELQNENNQEELNNINDHKMQENEAVLKCVDLLVDIKNDESQSKFIQNSFSVGDLDDYWAYWDKLLRWHLQSCRSQKDSKHHTSIDNL